MKPGVKEYYDYIVGDVMRGIEGITSKKMFGGYGLYLDGVVFAIITSDCQLYFKVDDDLKKRFQAYDSHPFVFSGYKGRDPVEMAYWTLPEEIMENREELLGWIEDSAEVSARKK